MQNTPFMPGVSPGVNIASGVPSPGALADLTVGYAYVPYQRAGSLYDESDALKYGTAFPELNKPLGVYGREFCADEEKRKG